MKKTMELSWTDRHGVLDPTAVSAQMKEYADLLHQAASERSDGTFSDRIAAWRGSLGWLNPDKWAGEGQLEAILMKAAEIRINADAFVVVGVGGSNQSARAAISALGRGGSPEVLYAGNTLSGWEARQLLERLEGRSVYINVIAKNFETLEPGTAFRVLRAHLRERYGDRWAERVIVTGSAGSHLQTLCDRHGMSFFEFPDDVGGRYTALTTVGLLPMAVAGIDIRAMRDGAQELRREMDASPSDHSALRYAALRTLLYREGRRLEMLSFFEPRWARFSRWWIQLFAESEGKDDLGLYPVAGNFSEDLHSIGQYVQEGTPILFETFLTSAETDSGETPWPGAADPGKPAGAVRLMPDEVDDRFGYLDGMDLDAINRKAFEGTFDAHADRMPCLRIEVPAIDARAFGGLFYFFAVSCMLSGAMLGVNPFDQNGVEGYKRNLFRALGKPQDAQRHQADSTDRTK